MQCDLDLGEEMHSSPFILFILFILICGTACYGHDN